MKLTDSIVSKFGSDKVMHFLGGGYIVALGALFGLWGAVTTFIITFIISYVKEQWLDTEFDWGDIFAAMGGGTISFLTFLITTLIL